MHSTLHHYASPRGFAATDSDMVACRDLLRHGSRTFLAASLFLPKSVRDPACALYAFCRIADDAVDIGDGGPEAVEHLRYRLALMYAGTPFDHPADRALADVVARFGIPADLPEALIEGFVWDAEGRTYETFDELVAYAVRVAGTVGVMMALLMGVRDPQTLNAALDLGIGMQLTNIARDVGEDARAGRIYLPLEWCRAEDIDPAKLIAQPNFTPNVARVIERLLGEADRFYRLADAGITHLPGSCQPGIRAARLLYAEIGQEVARNGYDSLSRRAFVPARRKAWLAANALVGGTLFPARLADTLQPQGVHLLNAVATLSPTPPAHGAQAPRKRPWWDMEQRMLWLLDLFERLERRDSDERQTREPRRMPAHFASNGQPDAERA